jgi:hypothetical protein
MDVRRETVAGGDGDFMTVRHLTVSGGQEEIGRALAEEARAAYGWAPMAADSLMGRARRAWFEREWPGHAARLRGAADAALVDRGFDGIHLDGWSRPPDGSGCSVAWCPPSASTDGHGRFGRNYDFFTTGWGQLFALLSGGTPPAVETPMASRPYVITSRPDDGPATTVLTMDTLDGCMEGVNEHGLAIALLLADVESVGVPVDAGPQVGLNPVQLPRFVLDTCATAEEARRALLRAKQYDLGAPLHYLIADAAGDAFVWERGPGGVEHVIDAGDGPMCVTNHPLHRHPDPADLPPDTDATMRTYERAAALAKRTRGATMSAADLRDAVDSVGFDAAAAGPMPLRTLWRTVLDVTERTMSARFYLGDDAAGRPRYSGDTVFTAA